MKFLKMVCGFAARNIAGRAMLALELLIGLVILFYFTDRLVVMRRAEAYMEACPDLAVFETGNTEAIAFAEANGRLTGNVVGLQAKNFGANGSEDLTLLFGTAAFYENMPIELCEGERFKTEPSADCSIIVPYSLGKTFKCGEVQSIQLWDRGSVRAYVSGVMSTDNVFEAYAATFGDTNKTIYALCRDDDPALKMESNAFGTAVINDAEASALMNAGITTVAMRTDEIKLSDLHTLAPLLFFAAALFVVFTCGYIGEQYLSLAEKEKTFAIYYMCGASRGVCFGAQLAADVLWLIATFVLAVAAARLIGIRLWPGGILIPFAYLALGTALISFATIRTIGGRSITETIRRRYYS